MLRRTQTAKIKRVDTEAGSADVLKLDWIVTRFPSLAKSKGIKGFDTLSCFYLSIALISKNDSTGNQ
jgi:hypothetical protein